MATSQRTVEFILEQIAEAGIVSARKMFGEYAIYCEGRLVALVCDDQLFVKPTAAGRAQLGAVAEGPPYPGAKPCFIIPGEKWDDREFMTELFRGSAKELPPPAAPRRRK